MKKYQSLVQVVLKAVALGMSVASMVLGYIGAVDAGTQVNLLSLGVFALAVAMLQNSNQ
jgi:threonine/homoserine efflux transporter RhtA